MIRRIGRTLFLALLAAQAGGCSIDNGNEPFVSAKPKRIATATELHRAFSENAIAAKAYYVDAPIRLTGKLYSVDSGSGDAAILTFQTQDDGIVSAKTVPGGASFAVGLRAGQLLTLECERVMYVLTVITPQGCRAA